MVYLGKNPPGSPWGLKSRGLAEGLLLYEQEHNKYGIPRRIATDPANAGFYEVDDSTIDYSEAAMDEWQKQNEKPDPGVQPVVRFDEKAKRASDARRERKRAEALEARQN